VSDKPEVGRKGLEFVVISPICLSHNKTKDETSLMAFSSCIFTLDPDVTNSVLR
jgi:hypothetical protein